MNRIHVIGPPGAGKSFLSDALGSALGLTPVRLDALRHGPGWTEVPDALFVERVAAAAADDRWVMDGSYPLVRPVIWPRADTVVWTDLDRPIVLRQVIGRSLRDWATGTELTPGNRERLRNFIKPWHPIRWAWTNHARFRERDLGWITDARWAHLDIVRLRSRRDIDAFIGAMARSRTAPDR